MRIDPTNETNCIGAKFNCNNRISLFNLDIQSGVLFTRNSTINGVHTFAPYFDFIPVGINVASVTQMAIYEQSKYLVWYDAAYNAIYGGYLENLKEAKVIAEHGEHVNTIVKSK
jgi:hypothetical protein